MKVFWSWQSDTPGKTGRFLVRDALREAIEQLRSSPEIEEPTTKESREALHLDHDIQGVSGSPDLVPTIFAKIDQAAVLIADVTLVGETPPRPATNGKSEPGKKLINSNVAIELGYGLKALTDRRVLLVFNEHYGSHEKLPFDLRHKGGAIVFNLPPTARKEEIETAKRQLVGDFTRRLEGYLETAAAPPILAFEEVASTFSPAAYFTNGETLAQVGDPDSDQVNYSYDTEKLCYLRLMPTVRPARPITLSTLRGAVGYAPLLHRAFTSMTDTNEYGAITWDPINNPPSGNGKLRGSTQVFENGEVWCITQRLIVRSRPALAVGNIRVPFVPAAALEASYYPALRSLLDFASSHLGIHVPCTVEAGVVGLRNAYLAVEQEQWAFKRNEVRLRGVISTRSDQEIDAFLLRFFSAVFDATGYERPREYYGFPPGPPKG